jgi:hypothetical protein
MSCTQTSLTALVLQVVGRDRLRMLAVGCSRLETTLGARLQALLTHDSLDALVVAVLPFPPQGRGHPGAAVAAFVLRENLFNHSGKLLVHGCLLALRPAAPRIIAAPHHSEQMAEIGHRVFA